MPVLALQRLPVEPFLCRAFGLRDVGPEEGSDRDHVQDTQRAFDRGRVMIGGAVNANGRANLRMGKVNLVKCRSQGALPDVFSRVVSTVAGKHGGTPLSGLQPGMDGICAIATEILGRFIAESGGFRIK